MNPFTGDSQILTEVLSGKSEIWKSMGGPIANLRIFDRTTESQGTIAFKLEITTAEIPSSLEDAPPAYPKSKAVYNITSHWDFMNLQRVEVVELSKTYD